MKLRTILPLRDQIFLFPSFFQSSLFRLPLLTLHHYKWSLAFFVEIYLPSNFVSWHREIPLYSHMSSVPSSLSLLNHNNLLILCSSNFFHFTHSAFLLIYNHSVPYMMLIVNFFFTVCPLNTKVIFFFIAFQTLTTASNSS